MDWFKKHVDTAIVLSVLASSFVWMHGRFDQLGQDISNVKTEVASIKTEVAIIKTVLIMKQIMPCELAGKGE